MMERELTMTPGELHALLKEIAGADDPGAPLRRLDITMGSLTDASIGEDTDHLSPYSPYARYLQRLLETEYASPSAAFHALHSYLNLLGGLPAGNRSILTRLDWTSVRRLLIGLLLAARLEEAEPGQLTLRDYPVIPGGRGTAVIVEGPR